MYKCVPYFLFGSDTMYFGSVRFFKDMIRLTVLVIVVGSIVLAIVFGILYSKEKNRTAAASAQLTEISAQKENRTENYSAEEYLKKLKDSGMTDKQIIELMQSRSPEDFEQVAYGLYGNDEKYLFSEYADKCPDMYVTPPESFAEPADMTVYLTFDDAPSVNTDSILQILESHNIKATFFVTKCDTPEQKERVKRIYDAGHKIGMHSYTHDYPVIYADVNAFLEDMDKCRKGIFEATGENPDILRFPGGSVNAYNRFFYRQLAAEMVRRGYVYYDWNVSAEDASVNANWTSIYRNVTDGMKNRSNAVVLLHDTKYETVTTLDDIINALEKEGYSFDKLDHNIKPCTFA